MPAIRTQLAEAVEHCWKRWCQDRDLLTPKQERSFRLEIQKAQNACTARHPDAKDALEKLTAAYSRCFPPARHSVWRENGEVLLVALIVAMTIRAFFLQPFKIPTGSMQPTLNGITVHAAQGCEKAWWYRWISLPLFGQSVIQVIAQSDGEFDPDRVRNTRSEIVPFTGRTIPLLTTEGVSFEMGKDIYSVPIEWRVFRNDVLGESRPGEEPLLKRGQQFHKGDIILHCIRQTGDFLFVDRFTYNFRKPHRGEVFVFDTIGINMPSPGEFYIKRLTGVPGDSMQIREPDLYINGQKIDEPIGFRRVMSCKDGYRGYSNSKPYGVKYLSSPDDHLSLQRWEYVAMGDNSWFSFDSRFWGPVPYPNTVGRGFFVYWPFTGHFGRIQ
jgi:signal peptidase I